MLHWCSSECSTILCFCLLFLYLLQDVYRNWPDAGVGNTWDTVWFLVSCGVGLRYLAAGRQHKEEDWIAPLLIPRSRTAVVTGATSGIGYEVAAKLFRHGFSLVLVGDDAGRLEATKNRLLFENAKTAGRGEKDLAYAASHVQIVPHTNLADFDSVRSAAAKISSLAANNLSLVVHCAATLRRHHTLVKTTSRTSQSEKKGEGEEHEAMLAVNFLGLVLLNELLLPLLRCTAEQHKGSQPSRIVFVASCAHTYLGLWEKRRPFDLIRDVERNDRADYSITSFVGVYGLSKLCVLYYSDMLARRLQLEQATAARSKTTSATPLVQVCACHPGIICSGLYRHLIPRWLAAALYYPSLLLFKTTKEGAETVLHCCLAKHVVQGGYYVDTRDYSRHGGSVCCLSKHAQNAEEAARVMEWAMSQVKL